MTLEDANKAGYHEVYFTFDCIGDTILLMSALKYLCIQNKKKVLMGTLYKELIENCDYIDVLDNFCEDILCRSLYEKTLSFGINPIFISSTDFVIKDNKYFPVWGKHHILLDVCSKLGIKQKIPIRPFFYLTDSEKQEGQFYNEFQIAIVAGGNQKYKALSYSLSQNIILALNDTYNFVQVGSPTDPLLEHVLDCRGWKGLRGTASILYNSDLFIGGIGGLMHLARAVDCRSVIAYSSAEPLSLANYACNINIFAPEPKCSKCGKFECFPYLITCPEDFSCIKGIQEIDLIEAIKLQISKKNQPLETDYSSAKPDIISGMEAFFKRFGNMKE